MSNFRDDVRDMLKTLKGAKPSTASPDSSKPAESESPEPAGKLEKGAEGASEKMAQGDKKEGAASDLPLTDEEDLLDDILDLEEGDGGNNGEGIEDIDAEAEALLADSDNEESEENNKSADKIELGSKKKDSCEFLQNKISKYCHAMAFGGIFLEISRHYTLCTKINFVKKNLVKSNQAAKRKIHVSFCQSNI